MCRIAQPRLLVLAAALFGRGVPAVRANITRCTNDTFGMAGEHYPRPFGKGVESLPKQCAFRYANAARYPLFVLNYYPNIEEFAAYRGIDLVPERHFEYAPGHWLGEVLQKWIPGKNGPKAQTRRIQLASCDIPQDDGGAYVIQRVGPLVSTGGYDYWQFGWPDTFSLKQALKANPDGIMFTLSFSGPVDANSKPIGHPPIHIHHIHITPSPGVFPKMSGQGCLSGLEPEQCYMTNLAIEQHGDYQCKDTDGGVDCFFERTADGHAKVLTTTLDLEGEINDVRAPDSEPMMWWYQVVLRWFPRTVQYKPLSQHFTTGPGNYIASDQRTNVLVFPVNTTTRSVYWYTGLLRIEGELTRNKLHSHNTMFHSALYFHATPEDLGLDDPMFWPKEPSIPLDLNVLGFRSFREVEALLLGKLARAQKRWDVICRPSDPSCASGRPDLTCESWVDNEDFVDPVSGKTFAYDRRAPCCCKPRRFRRGDPFTVVAFLDPMKTPPGPWSPDKTPPLANMHIHWLLTYRSSDNRSHYTVTTYNQNPHKSVDFVENDLSRYPAWRVIEGRMFGFRGVNNKALSLWQRLKLTQTWAALVLLPWTHELLGALVLVLLILGVLSWHLALKCRRVKHAQDHPMVQCVQNAPCGLPEEVHRAAAECTRRMEAAQHDD